MISFLKLHQEKLLFIISGGIQYLLDMSFFTVMVLLFDTNMNINIFSRIGAGSIGFYINGYIVFKTLKKKSPREKLNSAVRFLMLLVLMTIISSFFLSFFSHKSNLHFIIAKALIEIVLAILSFLIQKYFVYRHKEIDAS